MIVVVQSVCPHILIHFFIPQLFPMETAVKTNSVSAFLEHHLEGEEAIPPPLQPPQGT